MGPWVGDVLGVGAEVGDKLERLHKKAIAGMVLVLDAIADEWRAREETPAVETPTEETPPSP